MTPTPVVHCRPGAPAATTIIGMATRGTATVG